VLPCFASCHRASFSSITSSYQIKEIRRHGKAASADMSLIPKELARLQPILSRYEPCTTYNGDETGLYMYQQPTRSLADRQLAGKKQNKARITVFLVTNADRSDKRPPLYIGKSKKPRCFKKKSGEQLGFDYHNNTKAWMTKIIFEP
jgi:hypothetical protein